MKVTLNTSEVEDAVRAYVSEQINIEGSTAISMNEDGTATVYIGEEVSHGDDNPPVVETDKPVKRRQRRTNPQEAKHRPVDTPEVEPETPTLAGGQTESSTLEAEAAEPEAQGDDVQATVEALKEEATAEAEADASQEVAEEAAAQEEVQEKVEAEKPATAKPSLFAGLKR